ncbi:MAG: phosphoglucomutase [Candidatus Aegiribacteria sp. MLS_C]|nr:MAG: phosphoglucomutase [Candidatus Aegiribacteria sp. MLS_C]
MKAFKAYDIRGVWGRDFDGDTVYRIGFHLPALLEAERVLVGYDCRESTPEIFDELSRGIMDSGAGVVEMGFATTPMVYYATAARGFDASVQITASHNSREYNGLKISRTGSLPVGYDTGLKQLEEMVMSRPVQPAAFRGDRVRIPGIREEYVSFLTGFLEDLSRLRIAVDCSNGMASLIAGDVLGKGPRFIFDTMDGRFPNHQPNPLDEENTRQLKQLVLEEGMDVGVIFDGDGDRVMFIDERGRFVRPDIMTAVLGLHYLSGAAERVLHDIRTSRGVIEFIERMGGRPFMWKVGHSHAKMKMREIGAVYGGELAGHYYFRDFYSCDSGMLAAVLALNILAERKEGGKGFADLVDSVNLYANSGEINFRTDDKASVMEALRIHFSSIEEPSAYYDFDGYRMEFPNWWFNVRPSNTEPYLRLVVEAADHGILSARLAEIRGIVLEKGGSEA